MNPRLVARILHKTDRDSDCMIWKGSKNIGGYGLIHWEHKTRIVHRFLYIHLFGEIKGLEIDHLCRKPACVNPFHLEAVTASENCRRRNSVITACPYGHEYSEENTGLSRDGSRYCKTCNTKPGRRSRKAILNEQT